MRLCIVVQDHAEQGHYGPLTSRCRSARFFYAGKEEVDVAGGKRSLRGFQQRAIPLVAVCLCSARSEGCLPQPS